MTQKRKGLRSMLLALVGCTCSGTAAADSHPSSQTLYPLGTQGSFAGPDNLFTGDVKVDTMGMGDVVNGREISARLHVEAFVRVHHNPGYCIALSRHIRSS